jgi:predicted HTH transcriptional regulator
MTDDTAQSAPPAESAPAPEPVAQATPPESAPPTAESSPVVEQATPAEPAMEPPEVEMSTPEPQATTQSTSTTSQQQTPAAQSSPQVPSSKWSATDRAHAIAKHVGRKEARLARVIEMVKEKGRITNDDIEKLLYVSDATASRYGTILVRRGLLKREGKGRGVRYVAS